MIQKNKNEKKLKNNQRFKQQNRKNREYRDQLVNRLL